jgi:hypothetical protein
MVILKSETRHENIPASPENGAEYSDVILALQ